MALTLTAKLKIKEGMTLLTINAPKNFAEHLEPLPNGVKLSTTSKSFQQLHWFVKTIADVQNNFSKVLSMLHDDVICWIYYPKESSGIQTDLTRDKGWEIVTRQKKLQWLTLISFDETWSTFAIRLKNETNTEKKQKPVQRPILDYIDSKTKTIRLPEDLEKLLTKNKKASTFFETLSFTNKKEYVEWIVTAKKEETRTERLKGTIDRLEKSWKNPRNI